MLDCWPAYAMLKLIHNPMNSYKVVQVYYIDFQLHNQPKKLEKKNKKID